MVGWCTISVVCVLIHPAYDLAVQCINFGFASVGCPSLITLPTNCYTTQYFVGRGIFHGDEVVKRS